MTPRDADRLSLWEYLVLCTEGGGPDAGDRSARLRDLGIEGF